VAFNFSTKITIEEYIVGREFTVGIIDIYKSKNNFERLILPIVEIKFKGTHVIQSSLVKDNPNLMEEIIPAKISSNEVNKLRKQSLMLYEKLGCLGVARFDVRQSRKNKEFYFLENNTCPGILNYKQSDLPKQLKSFNMSLEIYVEQMIEVGMNRPENKLEQYL
jgi:D-alanine-D-alanine ligase